MNRPAWAEGSDLLRDYYDHEWGFPVRDVRGVYERITLEGFQSGLSWVTVLRKRPAFRAAFDGFGPATVALTEAGEHLGELVWSFRPEDPSAGFDLTQSPESLACSKALKKRGFVFVGPVTMFALMQAIGILEHRTPLPAAATSAPPSP